MKEENKHIYRESDGGVYVHVAVCRSKCIYCDFYSVVSRRDFDWNRYSDAMVEELSKRRPELDGMRNVTLYIGGGTPSLMPVGVLSEMVRRMREIIIDSISPDGEIIETTMEVNPDDVTEERATLWRESGIDRISMGVQSLCDDELKAIGRRHDSARAVEAYRILSNEFGNVSLDMMFGLPGQTLSSLRSTLSGFIRLHPRHISAYSLMYEERTALTRLRDAGKIKEADDDLSQRMFEEINEELERAGYRRYEISNYALSGYESKHNSSYWRGKPYIGIGPSAHSYDGARRRSWNVADIPEYMDRVEKGEKSSTDECLTLSELIEEKIMTRLRTSDGLAIEDFRACFGNSETEKIMEKAKPLSINGFLKIEDGCIRLTDKGVMISDEIIVELF